MKSRKRPVLTKNISNPRLMSIVTCAILQISRSKIHGHLGMTFVDASQFITNIFKDYMFLRFLQHI